MLDCQSSTDGVSVTLATNLPFESSSEPQAWARGPRQLAPQQPPPAANLDPLAPIWASPGDMAHIGEDPRKPIGHTQHVAADLVEATADDAALRAAWLGPRGFPSADSDSRRVAALPSAITPIATELDPTDRSDL